jgi:hypothetical protein
MDIAGPKVGSCCCWCCPARCSHGSYKCVYCSNGNTCYGDLPGKGVLLSVHQLMCDHNLLCKHFRQHANAYLCRHVVLGTAHFFPIACTVLLLPLPVLQDDHSNAAPHNFQAAAEFRPMIDQLYQDLCARWVCSNLLSVHAAAADGDCFESGSQTADHCQLRCFIAELLSTQEGIRRCGWCAISCLGCVFVLNHHLLKSTAPVCCDLS